MLLLRVSISIMETFAALKEHRLSISWMQTLFALKNKNDKYEDPGTGYVFTMQLKSKIV